MFPKGIYVLVLRLPRVRLRVGALGKLELEGDYAYVGSNQAGGRIERHLRGGKRPKWHIDYLTEEGVPLEVFTMGLGQEAEEELARRLAGRFPVVQGFGNSDCDDPGHLFRVRGGLQKELAGFAGKRGVDLERWKVS